jgi:hypothetical protein
MVNLFDNFFALQEIGFFDIFLPFILVFAVSFGVLEKIELFGKHGKGANFIISMVLGLLFLQNEVLVQKMQLFLSNASLALVIIVVFLIFLGSLIGEKTNWTQAMSTIALIAAIGFIWWSLVYNPFDDDYGNYGPTIWDRWYELPIEIQSILLFVGIPLLIFFIFFRKKSQGGWKALYDSVQKGLRGEK